MNKIYKITFFLIIFSPLHAKCSEVLIDPVRYIVNNYVCLSEEHVLKAEIDINNDGKKELFLSLSKSRIDSSGNIWTVFIRSGDGWIEAKSRNNDGSIEEFNAIIFHRKVSCVGFIEEIDKYGLATYVRGNPGTLAVYTIENDIVEVDYVKNFDARNIYEGRYNQLFKTRNFTIEEIKVSDVSPE